MSKFLRAGPWKIRVSPTYVCSCGKTYFYHAWAEKHANQHDGIIAEISAFERKDIGSLYLINKDNLQFNIMKPTHVNI